MIVRIGHSWTHWGRERRRGRLKGADVATSDGGVIRLSDEDRRAINRAINFARRQAGVAEPRTPESDGRLIGDIVRTWYTERAAAMTAR